MKKIIFLLPILAVCACNKTQTYTVGTDANCSGLEESSPDPVFCTDTNGNPINGIVKQYYENGKLHVVANVVDGKTDGLSKLYNPDEKLYMEINWKNGEMIDAKVYDENGNVIETKINE